MSEQNHNYKVLVELSYQIENLSVLEKTIPDMAIEVYSKLRRTLQKIHIGTLQHCKSSLLLFSKGEGIILPTLGICYNLGNHCFVGENKKEAGNLWDNPQRIKLCIYLADQIDLLIQEKLQDHE